MNKSVFTGFKDDNNQEIWVRDILKSEWGYLVMVCQDKDDNSFYGSLICEIGHSCRNIPYALNEGRGYTLQSAFNRR